jgi:hypothetical protein
MLFALDGGERSASRSISSSPERSAYDVHTTEEAALVPEPVCKEWGREKSLPLLVKQPADSHFPGIIVTRRQCAGSPQWLSCKSRKEGKETEQRADNGHKDRMYLAVCVSRGVAIWRYQRATER